MKRPKENMTANKGGITRIVSGHLRVSMGAGVFCRSLRGSLDLRTSGKQCSLGQLPGIGIRAGAVLAALSAPAKRRMAQPSHTSSTN